MESLNLNTLASSLPTSNLANAEKDLMNDFKAAALSITTLYRSSRKTSKKAYNTGYAAACQDLLQMIQQAVSDSESEGGSGMPTIERVMDWVEARLEAIRAREEEEDEDEEREREKGRADPLSKVKNGLIRANSAPVSQQKDNTPAPSTSKPPHSIPAQSMPPSPTLTPLRPLSTSLQRGPKSRLTNAAVKESSPLNPNAASVPTISPVTHIPTSPESVFALRSSNPLTSGLSAPALIESRPIVLDNSLTVSAGAKRRHAMMMMLDSAPSAADSAGMPAANTSISGSIAGSSRRRTKSSRGTSIQVQNQNQGVDAMDVEEDGRERKRVARR